MRDLLVLLVHFLTTLARLLGPGGTRAVIAEGSPFAHTVDNAGSGGDRLLTMVAGDTGTVTPDKGATIFAWRVDLNFYAKLNRKGKKSSFWSILFNAELSDVHADFGDAVNSCITSEAKSEANTSLNIERASANTWDIFTGDIDTGGPQPACLFKHTGGITAMGIVDVDLSYTITCVDLCPAPAP